MDVSPDKQNIDSVFSNTTYHIDFYQRDYRWTDEPVLRLLDDIFFKFNEEYERHKDATPSEKLIDGKYSWYYLNTYVTNTIDGKVFVVDGQQRLTTLTLINIKLLHMAKDHKSDLEKWIDSKIAGQTAFHNTFWMSHVGHEATLKSLYDNKIDNVDTSSGITAVNMEKNFSTISKWLTKNLTDKHKLETFTLYYFRRLVLINLAVEQTDVPMVFEVINDRGVRLKPFEIMKGKLLGQIDKTTLHEKNYNGLWEEKATAINKYDEDKFDEFFRYWLKARFADTRKEGQRFDGDYHRAVFSSNLDEVLALNHNQIGVQNFLDGPFSYYTSVYQKILFSYENEAISPITYNKVNYIDGAFMLLLSACEINDPEEEKKLSLIPAELDRLFSLLQIQGAYDSNTFQEILFRISSEIRDAKTDTIRDIFDTHLKEEIEKRRMTKVSDSFQYIFFKQTGINLNARFKRYFFARIDEFLAKNMKLGMKHTLSNLVTKTGAKTGFHIEHILAQNDENHALFDGDEERFEQERNRLGGILLLKGKDNISSNNETYSKKLKTYANTLYWNETLREDSYKSKLDMASLKTEFNLDLQPMNSFGPEQLEQRQRLLFDIASIIWK